MEIRKSLKAKHPYVILQFIVFKKNEHQITEIKKLAKEIGVDKLTLKTAQVYDYKTAKDIIPENIKYSRYKKDKDGNYNIINKYYNHCWRSWQSCVITWDGNMVPCCFDKDADYKVGNVSENSFIDIWKSEIFKSFKTRLLQNRKDIDICQNCTEGTKFWI